MEWAHTSSVKVTEGIGQLQSKLFFNILKFSNEWMNEFCDFQSNSLNRLKVFQRVLKMSTWTVQQCEKLQQVKLVTISVLVEVVPLVVNILYCGCGSSSTSAKVRCTMQHGCSLLYFLRTATAQFQGSSCLVWNICSLIIPKFSFFFQTNI